MKVCFDYGHGGKDPGALYRGRRESDDVLEMGMEVARQLRQHGVIVHETRSGDHTVSLQRRCQIANMQDYDYFISFHRNAYMPEVARGAETYIYLNPSLKAYYMAFRIQRALADIGFRDRGVKKAKFYVLRKTKAPAILVEMGFIDHGGDNKLWDSKKDEIASALARAILGV